MSGGAIVLDTVSVGYDRRTVVATRASKPAPAR